MIPSENARISRDKSSANPATGVLSSPEYQFLVGGEVDGLFGDRYFAGLPLLAHGKFAPPESLIFTRTQAIENYASDGC